MMNIFDFMKTIRIEGAEVKVVTLNDSLDTVCVRWDFACPGHPTLTHKRVSRMIGKHMIDHLHLLVDDVKQIIEVSRNAQ